MEFQPRCKIFSIVWLMVRDVCGMIEMLRHPAGKMFLLLCSGRRKKLFNRTVGQKLLSIKKRSKSMTRGDNRALILCNFYVALLNFVARRWTRISKYCSKQFNFIFMIIWQVDGFWGQSFHIITFNHENFDYSS